LRVRPQKPEIYPKRLRPDTKDSEFGKGLIYGPKCGRQFAKEPPKNSLIYCITVYFIWPQVGSKRVADAT